MKFFPETSSVEQIFATRGELFVILKDLLNDELQKTLEVVENYVSEKAKYKYCISENDKQNVSCLLY